MPHKFTLSWIKPAAFRTSPNDQFTRQWKSTEDDVTHDSLRVTAEAAHFLTSRILYTTLTRISHQLSLIPL